MKKTYYISVARGEILRDGTISPYEFIVQATDDEITRLRMLFDAQDETSWDGFVRAQVPYVQYHDDGPNDTYDSLLIKVYAFIHEIGDETARTFIESMGILPKGDYRAEEHRYIPLEGDASQTADKEKEV